MQEIRGKMEVDGVEVPAPMLDVVTGMKEGLAAAAVEAKKDNLTLVVTSAGKAETNIKGSEIPPALVESVRVLMNWAGNMSKRTKGRIVTVVIRSNGQIDMTLEGEARGDEKEAGKAPEEKNRPAGEESEGGKKGGKKGGKS